MKGKLISFLVGSAVIFCIIVAVTRFPQFRNSIGLIALIVLLVSVGVVAWLVISKGSK